MPSNPERRAREVALQRAVETAMASNGFQFLEPEAIVEAAQRYYEFLAAGIDSRESRSRILGVQRIDND